MKKVDEAGIAITKWTMAWVTSNSNAYRFVHFRKAKTKMKNGFSFEFTLLRQTDVISFVYDLWMRICVLVLVLVHVPVCLLVCKHTPEHTFKASNCRSNSKCVADKKILEIHLSQSKYMISLMHKVPYIFVWNPNALLFNAH